MFISFYYSLNVMNPFNGTLYNEPLLGIGMTIGFILYVLSSLPFKSAYQNYRSVLIRLGELCIFMVLNYYKTLTRYVEPEIRAHIHAPALLQLSVIIICLSLSFLALVYEIYSDIKKWREKRQKT